jgi:hypothetical protein
LRFKSALRVSLLEWVFLSSFWWRRGKFVGNRTYILGFNRLVLDEGWDERIKEFENMGTEIIAQLPQLEVACELLYNSQVSDKTSGDVRLL